MININNEKLKYLLIGVVVILVAAILVFFVTRPAGAEGKNHDNVPGNECINGEHTYNPHCVTPTPKECKDWENIKKECLPTVTPTEEVTPTQEPEATPTPTEEKHEVGQPGNPLVDTNQCTIKDCSTHTTVPSGPPSTGFSPYDGSQVGWK